MIESKYKELLELCLLKGFYSQNRTGVATYKLFAAQLKADLSKGFPVMTSKKIFFDKALAEFEWMIAGRTDIEFLNERGVQYWNSFAKNGNVGKVYGYQLRKYNGTFDQFNYALQEIGKGSRRAVITFWNPTDLKEQALPSCYTEMVFVKEGPVLNMSFALRSSDMFLGLPYDMIIGALFLTHAAELTGHEPGTVAYNLADAHIYENHIKQVEQYIDNPVHPLPKYKNGVLNNYKHENYIKAELVK